MIKGIIRGLFNTLGYNIVPIQKEIFNKNELIEILGFYPDEIRLDFLNKGLDFLKNLKKKKGAIYSEGNKSLIVEIETLFFNINSWEELLILNEIFIEGVYNVDIKEDFIFIDVGMNVGFTSLYFANRDNCKKVYAFEPFEETLKLADVNMNLNKCTNKISIQNYGLGFPSRKLLVNYSNEYKGSVGIDGLAEYIDQEYVTKKLELKIEDVALNFSNIIREADCSIIVKVDCEGAEYEIIERLLEKDLLSNISIFLIEWHIKGPEPLKTIFIENGFKVLSFNERSENIGMIYAFRK